MKRLIFQIAALLISLQCAASNYRGMFEIGGGPIFSDMTIRIASGQYKNNDTTFGGIFTTAHGCQFTPWLFAGAGFGVNCEWMKSSSVKSNAGDDSSKSPSKRHLISIPLFLDVRWDLDINRKLTPYADLRLGYQLGMDGMVMYKVTSVTDPSFIAAREMKSADGMYVQASAGVRWKASDNLGVNLGISYIPILKREIQINGDISGNRNFLLINLGIDIQGKGKSSMKEDKKAKLYRLQQKRLKQQSKKYDIQ